LKCYQVDLNNFLSFRVNRLLIWKDTDKASTSSAAVESRVGLPLPTSVTHGTFHKVLFSISRPMTIVDVCASQTGFAFVTLNGDAFQCGWSCTAIPKTYLTKFLRDSGPGPYDFQRKTGKRKDYEC